MNTAQTIFAAFLFSCAAVGAFPSHAGFSVRAPDGLLRHVDMGTVADVKTGRSIYVMAGPDADDLDPEAVCQERGQDLQPLAITGRRTRGFQCAFFDEYDRTVQVLYIGAMPRAGAARIYVSEMRRATGKPEKTLRAIIASIKSVVSSARADPSFAGAEFRFKPRRGKKRRAKQPVARILQILRPLSGLKAQRTRGDLVQVTVPGTQIQIFVGLMPAGSDEAFLRNVQEGFAKFNPEEAHSVLADYEGYSAFFAQGGQDARVDAYTFPVGGDVLIVNGVAPDKDFLKYYAAYGVVNAALIDALASTPARAADGVDVAPDVASDSVPAAPAPRSTDAAANAFRNKLRGKRLRLSGSSSAYSEGGYGDLGFSSTSTTTWDFCGNGRVHFRDTSRMAGGGAGGGFEGGGTEGFDGSWDVITEGNVLAIAIRTDDGQVGYKKVDSPLFDAGLQTRERIVSIMSSMDLGGRGRDARKNKLTARFFRGDLELFKTYARFDYPTYMKKSERLYKKTIGRLPNAASVAEYRMAMGIGDPQSGLATVPGTLTLDGFMWQMERSPVCR